MNGRTTVIAAGRAPSRNFVANTYPDRSSSHFLYFVGCHLPGAFLVMDQSGSRLYVNRPLVDDALWHGQAPTLAERSKDLGLEIAYASELDAKKLQDATTMPVMDPSTNQRLTTLLHRQSPIEAGVISDEDEQLAQTLVALRMIHDENAIMDLRRAANCTVAAHGAALGAIEAGRYEYEIWAAMQKVLTERGMTAAYQPIVTVHGEILHAHGHGNQLKDGDLILIDVGAETENGWAGDVTRTWPVNGHFSSTQAAIHQVVYDAQEPPLRGCDLECASKRSI